MNVLRLWGRLSSINVRKVVWTAQELDLPLQRTDAGGQFGLVCEPHFLHLNPHGLVPVMEDEGSDNSDGSVVLWESNTIVRYLCAKHAPGRLYPEALPARFVAEQWMDWQQTTLHPAARTAFLQWIRTAPEQRQLEQIDQSVAATEPLLTLLDAHLERQPFVAGEHFTMADIPLGCEVQRWLALPQERPSWPHLERWFTTVQTRPGALGVLDQPLV